MGTLLSNFSRQWHSDDDIYSTLIVGDKMKTNPKMQQQTLPPLPQQPHPDLLELERMQRQLDQLSADLDAKRRELRLERTASAESRTAPAALMKKRTPSMLQLLGQAAQQKRHSIGSPTDVVKTWVYRRR